MPRKGGPEGHQSPQTEPQAGDSGIWVTCDVKTEPKCVAQLRPLFEEVCALLRDSNAEIPAIVPSSQTMGSRWTVVNSGHAALNAISHLQMSYRRCQTSFELVKLTVPACRVDIRSQTD